MAEPFDTLILVQEHDTTIDQLRHRKATLPQRASLVDIRERHAVLAASVRELQDRVGDLAGRQRSIEDQIATSAKRRHEIEQRMLTGEVSASRDLQAMDVEVHHLAERQSELEEQEIELLEEEDPLDVALAEHTNGIETLTAEEEQLQLAIVEIDASIDAEIERASADRDVLARSLPDDLTERYETLRVRLGGVGAARLVGDHCGGCHLAMPSVEVERIRHLSVDQVATCDQCGRILVH